MPGVPPVEAMESPLRTSSLEVEVEAPADGETAVAILGVDRETWLGPAQGAVTVEGVVHQRFLLDLVLPVGHQGRIATFRKAAFVDVGPLETDRGAIQVAVAWRASTFAPLFPVFAGRLAWHAGRLLLNGAYAPPGGTIGLAADRLLLNLAARGTARWLLGRVASAMVAASGPQRRPRPQR